MKVWRFYAVGDMRLEEAPYPGHPKPGWVMRKVKVVLSVPGIDGNILQLARGARRLSFERKRLNHKFRQAHFSEFRFDAAVNFPIGIFWLMVHEVVAFPDVITFGRFLVFKPR